MYCTLPRVIFNNQSIFQARNYHLFHKNLCNDERFQTGFLKFYSIFTKNVSISNSRLLHANFQSSPNITMFLHTRSFLRYIKRGLQKFPLSLKEQSVHIVRLCTQQCECVLAQRIRRGQQMFSLYSKLWDEVALKEMIQKMRHQFSKKGKEFFLTAAGVSVYNWEKEKISDDEISGHLKEIEAVYNLRDLTVVCSNCHQRKVVDMELPNKEYCKCVVHNQQSPENGVGEWSPFIEREDLLIWRKESEEHTGLYAYKVYGSYSEITAEDFLNVQVDTEFRMIWDNTAINLKVVEQDKKTNSDIVYWEMKWPRMFANRDYVFNRRFYIDREKNIIVVINKGTKHPNIPQKPENHRVQEYWSFMVIKAYTNIDKPGMEFSLTYFDNPGVSIPASVTSWVAMTGLPDFQVRLRQAAREYKKFLQQKNADLEGGKEGGTKSKKKWTPTYTSGQSAREFYGELDEVKSDELSEDKPSPAPPEPHTSSPPTSRMYLKQFHAWQLFV